MVKLDLLKYSGASEFNITLPLLQKSYFVSTSVHWNLRPMFLESERGNFNHVHPPSLQFFLLLTVAMIKAFEWHVETKRIKIENKIIITELIVEWKFAKYCIRLSSFMNGHRVKFLLITGCNQDYYVIMLSFVKSTVCCSKIALLLQGGRLHFYRELIFSFLSTSVFWGIQLNTAHKELSRTFFNIF